VYHKVTFISVKGWRREGNANLRSPIVDSQEKKSKSQTEMDRRKADTQQTSNGNAQVENKC
jgi:hypothetical protein